MWYNAAYNPQDHQGHQKFQHKKFPLFDEIADLIDSTWANGANAFHAGKTSLHESNQDASYNDPNIDPALRAISINVGSATKVTKTPHTSVKKPGVSFYDSDNLSSSDVSTMACLCGRADFHSFMWFELQETAAPVPSTFKQKRARSPAPTAENSNKLCRISAGQGMYKMAESMDKVANAMNPSSPPSKAKATSSDPQAEAITYIESNGGLSEIEFVGAFELFLSDADFAKAYMRLQTDYARANVPRNRLAKLGGDQK